LAPLIPYLRHTSTVVAPASLLQQKPDDLRFRAPVRFQVNPSSM
jgi:hypothetical protein